MNRAVTSLFVVTFLVAVAVNFVWEIGQSVLFAPMGGWLSGSWRCFVASLGDGVIVVTIAAAGWLLFRRVDWFIRPGLAGYVFTAALGIAVAVLIERWSVSAGRWSYSGGMPMVPVLDVGLVPVVQMVILPPLVFAVMVSFNARKEQE